MNKNTHIFELELSTRANNALLGYSVYEYENNAWKHESLDTIGKVIEKSENDLLRATNLGRKSLNEIIYALDQHGFKLLNYKENVKLPKKIPMKELNLRDYFATKAFQSLISNALPDCVYYTINNQSRIEIGVEILAKDAYLFADAMMEARKE
jgi:hypothetical protein